jgi:AcrR family transcriptional regulator
VIIGTGTSKKVIGNDIMTEETREIIMGAALKVFAEEGYTGAKTRIIAKESGFSEMTLFRKFKSKENLFDTVLMEQKEYLLEEASIIFRYNDMENPVESFKGLIQRVHNLMEENFLFISLYVNERRRIPESILDEFIIYLSRQIELRFPDIKINTRVFAFNIFYFIYAFIFDKYKNCSIIDHEEALNEFINNCTVILIT